MALPKKGTRTINVDNHVYRWKITPDTSIILIIESDENNGQIMQATFDYIYKDSKNEKHYIITPEVVKKSIVYGLTNGWTPLEPRSKIHFKNLNREIKIFNQE